tara:strand:+ start:499 stop:1212 length:714 start_codon:yes stop_codon:yes gene_type:complete
MPRCLAAVDTPQKAEQSSRMRASIRNDGNVAELLIMDQIGEDSYGDGVSAESVVNFLRINRTKPINVRINSPGGLVYEGLVIMNALASHDATVTVTIEGLAYSAASFIAMAGDTVRMYKASDFGIHRASIIAMGNRKEIQSVRDWLNTIDNHLVDIYQAKTGQPRKKIIDWLDGVSDGTVFSADEALKAGFCDEVIDPKAGNRSSSNGRTSTNRTAGPHTTLQEAKNRLMMLRRRGL